MMDKRQWKPAKELQFSQSACQGQSAKRSDSQSNKTSSGKGSFSTCSKTSSSSKCREGKKFWRFLVFLSATGGRHSRAALVWWRFFILGILSPSTISHLCCGNLSSSLPTTRGLPRLRHFRKKWKKCCRKVSWN